MARELLLPDFHPFGVRVLGVVDAQAVAEDAAQAVHHLNGQRYLRQQVEHLAVLLQLALYKMDVDFSLAAGSDAVQQRYLLLQEREQYLVVGVLLSGVELLDEFGVWLAAVVQSSHLHLVGFQQSALDECVQRFCRAIRGVEQFVAADTLAALSVVPTREGQKLGEDLLLLVGTLQHVEGYVKRLLILKVWSQPDVGVGLRTVAVLSLQACGQCRLVDFADGRHVVVGYPLPQLQLGRQQDGTGVEHLVDVLHLIALRGRVVDAGHQTDIVFRLAEGNTDTYPLLHLLLQLLWHGIGEIAVERQREYDVSKQLTVKD